MNLDDHAEHHLTLLEKLWITIDPEFPAYQAAFSQLRERSAAAPEFPILLRRVFPLIYPCDHE